MHFWCGGPWEAWNYSRAGACQCPGTLGNTQLHPTPLITSPVHHQESFGHSWEGSSGATGPLIRKLHTSSSPMPSGDAGSELTLSGQAEFVMIFLSSFEPDWGWTGHVDFVLAMVGISLASALMASGLGTGVIAQLVTETRGLCKHSKAIEDSSQSLASLSSTRSHP